MTRRLGPQDVADAARLLRAGELVAFPTETVCGLGADARNGRAVAAVFEAKGRPHFNPLICHFPDAEAAFAEVMADDRARALAAAFWPGPLTLVLPRRRPWWKRPAGACWCWKAAHPCSTPSLALKTQALSVKACRDDTPAWAAGCR